jgi:hypothetical protein
MSGLRLHTIAWRILLAFALLSIIFLVSHVKTIDWFAMTRVTTKSQIEDQSKLERNTTRFNGSIISTTMTTMEVFQTLVNHTTIKTQDHQANSSSSVTSLLLASNACLHQANCTCPTYAVAETTSSTTNPLLRDIHIAMIGDSLMRYQYLSLAYRLRYGVWFDDSKWYYNLVSENTFADPFQNNTWGAFLYHTNRILQPYEVCDCHRKVSDWMSDVVENRYYYDPILNNSLVYVQAFGHVLPLAGRLEPHQVRTITATNNSTWQTGALQQRGALSWKYKDWSDVIRNHILHLEPQPRHIVLNAGSWRHSFQHNLSKVVVKLVRIMQDTPQYQYAWRTTTYRNDRAHRGFKGDQCMCDLLPICVNVTFTRQVRQDLYWDRLHFYEPVYRVQNEQMLALLGYLPSGYERMNASTLF